MPGLTLSGVSVIGTVRFIPTSELILSLKDKFNIKTAVETGTYHGQSTSWLAENFEKVITIDIKEELQEIGIKNCRLYNNISFLLGDSKDVLATVVEALTEPVLFWLDAHNASQIFGLGQDSCPILEELDIINASPFKHFILIDDAHCFKPPVPHDAKVWPEISALEAKAKEGGYIMAEAHDVIVMAPEAAQLELFNFTKHEIAGNPAYATMTLKTLKKRMNRNALPGSFKASGSAIQGEVPASMAKIKKLEARITEVVETHYGLMIVPIHDTNQTPALRGGFALDHANIDLLADILQHRLNGAVFLDIGANVGAFSFGLRPFCGTVHAFEPQRQIFNMLCGSVALNGWDKVFCHNVALSDKPGQVEIPQYDYSKPMSFGSIEFGPEQKELLGQARGDNPTKREFVSVVTLDSYLFARVDMIKIDAEGMEEQILKGASHTILFHRPILFIEHTKSDKNKLIQQLRDYGYASIKDVGDDLLAIFNGV